MHKTQLVEGANAGGEPADLLLEQSIRTVGFECDPLPEEGLFRVRQGREVLGFVERHSDRFALLYSFMDAVDTNKLVRDAVTGSHQLDCAWFSGIALDTLWKTVISRQPSERYSRISFDYEAIFDEPLPEEEKASAGRPGHLAANHTKTGFNLRDRIGIIDERLPAFKSIYRPLYAMSRLRFPVASGGGEDLSSSGRLTNRSGSFTQHRAVATMLTNVYSEALAKMEEAAWGDKAVAGLGAPTYIVFREGGLKRDVLERWVGYVTSVPRNRFRMWARAYKVAAGRYHITAMDLHLGQPFDMHVSQESFQLMLPRGSCSNIINRFATMTQRHLDAGTSIAVGGKPLSSFFSGGASDAG